MAQQYSRDVLRRTVAHVCQLIGWHAIQSGPLDVLVHVLEKYILTLATQAHRYAEHYHRTEPNLDDLARAFDEADVRLSELREYARCVPARPPDLRMPPYPLPRESHLNFLKPGSREVLTRPVHVDEHLPPMLPEGEEPDRPPVAEAVEIPADEEDKTFKRPVDPVSVAKKPRLRLADSHDDCQTRELSSVMMTKSGFLSPAREGKLPEARTPVVVPDAVPDRKPPHPDPTIPSPAPNRLPDRPDRKPKRNRAVNGKVEKPKKRDRSSKHLQNRHLEKLSAQTNRAKPPSVVKNHSGEPSHPLQTLFRPDLVIKTIKREPDAKPVAKNLPERIPSFSNIVPKPPHEAVGPLDVVIKQEKPDPVKLTSQPDDRLKLNIFKKISTKIKEEKPSEIPEKISMENITVKVERPSPEPSPKAAGSARRKSPDSQSVVDLSSSRNSDVITINDDFDFTKRKIKQEPPDDPPKEEIPFRPKLSVVPHDILTGASSKLNVPMTAKEKREKKRKEKELKEERVIRNYQKMVKQAKIKQQMEAEAAAQNEAEMPNPGYPYFPYPGMLNYPGLIPAPGLIPGGNVFSNNPALRGLLQQNQNLTLNPFSMPGGPGGFLSSGPGLIPRIVNPHLSVNHGFGQPPRMPQPTNLPSFLRRPSLEVIPIADDDDARSNKKQSFLNSTLSIKEKEKLIANNFLANNVNTTITTTVKQSPSPKANPVIPMPEVKPDVTIQLNTPDKIKNVETPLHLSGIKTDVAILLKGKEKSEKKKDKLHKKEKKDREQKIKKKKDKKDKLKLKLERKKEKEEKQELKERIKKEKKEKRKEKEKQIFVTEGIVPKLTLKLGPSSPMLPPSPDTTKKLNIKPIVRKDEPPDSPQRSSPLPEEKSPSERSHSPELARISALVTRPPKIKTAKHNSVVKSETDIEGNNTIHSPPTQSNNLSPARKTRPPSTYAKYKRIYFKPIPKRNSSDFDDPINDLAPEEPEGEPEPIPNVPLGTPFYMDSQGNKIWICPACGKPDNGTPMIGCDGACDAWYHWVCVGIHIPPDDAEQWYCTHCIIKRTAQAGLHMPGHTGKKRGRKPKAEKLKEKFN